MESLQKINTLIEELPIENEWVYIQICNEMKNSNIAATLAICGIGFDKTKVIVIPHPKYKSHS